MNGKISLSLVHGLILSIIALILTVAVVLIHVFISTPNMQASKISLCLGGVPYSDETRLERAQRCSLEATR